MNNYQTIDSAFSEELLDTLKTTYRVTDQMQVHVLNGCDFDPNVAGFQGLISTNKEFWVY
jgi:hypothetical protein